MTCFAAKHSNFGVGGCCRLDLFLLNKIFFAMQEFLDVKNIKFLEASLLLLSEKYAWKLRKMKYQQIQERGLEAYLRVKMTGLPLILWWSGSGTGNTLIKNI